MLPIILPLPSPPNNRRIRIRKLISHQYHPIHKPIIARILHILYTYVLGDITTMFLLISLNTNPILKHFSTIFNIAGTATAKCN